MFPDELARIDAEVGLGFGQRRINCRLLKGLATMTQDDAVERTWRHPVCDQVMQEYMTMSDTARDAARARRRQR